MSKTLWVVIILAVLLVIAQAIRPDMKLPPENPSHDIRAALQVPPQVDEIVKRSCYDCHSSKTRWPWYARIAPSSWLLANDVSEGRKELSFSEFATYSPKRQAGKLKEICEQLDEKEMPLWYYLPLHPSAKLTDADRETLCGWAKQARAQILAAHPEAAQPRKPDEKG